MGVGGGVGREPKACSFVHLSREVAIVCSLKCINNHSLLVRPIRLLKAA